MDRLPTQITENGIHYTLHGDYYLPDLTVPEENWPIGKWGRMHEQYLREHKPALYSQLVLQGKLPTYLADLNEQAQERLEVLVRQMKHTEDVDERMKAHNQMLWVGRMNNIRQRAEDIVISELIFS